jgi:polysaccharide biosynthesis/export protein
MIKMLRVAHSHVLPVALVAPLAALFSLRSAAQIDLQQSITASQSQTMKARTPGNAGIAGANNISSSIMQQGPAMVPAHFAQLKLAQGFLLSINILDDSDFTGVFRVDEVGNLVLPELGSIHVAGKTVPEARQEITKDLLERGILKDPQVELNIVEYTAPQVTILGAVVSPGIFPLLAPVGLGDVLALAGDTTILAGDRIEITTPNGGSGPRTVHYSRGMDSKLLNSVVIQPGDTVQVTQAGVVYVLGGVTRPGGYVMQESGNLSVLEAISIAGGTAFTASVKSIYVMRRNRDNTTVWLELPYKNMTKGKVSDVQLHVNDVIYVPTSRVKSTLMSSQSLLAAISSASIYAGVVY